MKTLSIDIETFSSVNLQKCGVYKYAESEDFEILLFGYAMDGGVVQVVDLACGEEIPADIIEALTDDAVIKTAFNAAFERVCLSRYLSDLGVSLDPFHDKHPLSQECARYLNPASWHCTMIWSATLGLPLSLEGVGAVLGLEKQKLTEGKALIKYFCVPCAPTKVNGGRTRNLPEHTRYVGPLDVAQTVAATYGTGGNNQPFVVECPKTLKIRSGCDGGGKGALIQDNLSATLCCNNDQTVFIPKAYGICSKDSNAMKSANPNSGFYKADTSRTLDGNGGNPTCNQGGIAIVEGNGSRPSHHGNGYAESDVMYTLNLGAAP